MPAHVGIHDLPSLQQSQAVDARAKLTAPLA
jgi:hypothetical protein